MPILHDHARLGVSEVIQNAIQSIGGEMSLEEIYNLISHPPNPEMGHWAFPCFNLAKTLKKAPPMIASELAEKVEASDVYDKAVTAGPYLNFFAAPDYLGREVAAGVLDGSFFEKDLVDDPPKTMIEFSQPNTHKEMHVGHMRNLCLGDALIRLYRYCGYDVVSTTFPGDVGTHVAKTLWYLKNKNTEQVPSERKGEWLGRIYSTANNYIEELGEEEATGVKAEMGNILKELEQGSGEYYDLWKETREWSIELMNQVYEWSDVAFDVWYWESDVDADSVAYAKQMFEEGKLVESQGAIGMDLSDVDLGFCLLIKTDGTGLYATKDVELARRKFSEFGIQRSVYVVDQSQSHHFKQVFEVLKRLGFDQAEQCYHLPYELVELPDGKMSSRKGNIVPILSLIDQMEEQVKNGHLAAYRGDWTDEEIDNTAHVIAQGAIKYGMIRIDNNRKIIFNMDEWLKVDGDSGPYIQYACARVNSLVRKLGEREVQTDWSLLTDPLELDILVRLADFNTVAVQAVDQYKTALMTSYLYDLAKAFNTFYNQVPIGKAENEELKNARLSLAVAVHRALEKGLGLLGIRVPVRM